MVVAYLKVTEFCNIGCKHCYLPESVRADRSVMSEAVFNTALLDIKGICEQNSDSEVEIIWHGGEPLLVDMSYYEKLISIAESFFLDLSIKVNHTIQTSLIPYKSDWSLFLKKHMSGYVGVSIDFTSRDFGGSNQKYLNALSKRMSLAQSDGLTVEGNYVPTKLDLGNESCILDFFTSNNIATVCIDRFNAYKSQSDLRPTNKEHSEILINLLDESLLRIKNGEKAPFINVLHAGISGVLLGLGGDRWGTSCQKDFYVCNPDGKTNNCPDRISYDESFSSKGVQFVDSGVRMDTMIAYFSEHENLYCSSCEYNHWCKTGCPITSNNVIAEGDCSGYKFFLNHVKSLARVPENLRYLKKYIGFDEGL